MNLCRRLQPPPCCQLGLVLNSMKIPCCLPIQYGVVVGACSKRVHYLLLEGILRSGLFVYVDTRSGCRRAANSRLLSLVRVARSPNGRARQPTSLDEEIGRAQREVQCRSNDNGP